MIGEEMHSRFENLARNSTARALAISLIFHLLLFTSIEVAYQLGWIKQSILSSMLVASRNDPNSRVSNDAKRDRQAPPEQIPIVFVEVDPSQATDDAPKEATFYSSQNSRAANLEARSDGNIPKITGKQDKVPRTTDTPRVNPMPLQPSPQVESKAESERLMPESKARESRPVETEAPSGPQPGDMAFAKPSDSPKFSTELKDTRVASASGPAHVRPRTLPPALTQESRVAGEKMKQEGGMKRYSIAEGLDVKATPFGSYDAAIIAAIQKRWYDLLDERDFARGYTGKVVLTFRLISDGRVAEMHVEENEVSEILSVICQRAVQDPAPYPPWPNDMRRLVGGDYREVKFTFHHN